MDCKSSSLCFFDRPGILSDIQRTYTVDYYPISSISSSGPIEFEIPGSAEDYIDLNDIKLYLKVKVTKADGTKIDQTVDSVAINNLAISTLFQDASLTIGETQVEGGNMNYPYKAYFKTVTQFSASDQNSHMLSSGWYKDEEGKFDDKTNKGFVKRMALIDNNTSAEFFGPLFFDLFNQDRQLISSTDMRIKLQPS